MYTEKKYKRKNMNMNIDKTKDTIEYTDGETEPGIKKTKKLITLTIL
jgi:hypothetical protein